MIGTTVGNYRIVERLGDGGMGAVYRATDEMLDRDVAIKVLKPDLARNAALIERFRLEAVALARLNHPRIATLHGLERHGTSLLMIMEYVRGETLEAIVQRSGRIAWPRAAELCAAVLDALDHAHDKGVVHRDIKPANVMLAASGAVKVMDFGIARLMGKSRQTQVGHAVGTPMYMAPEQLRGEEVDGRTDLYAVGAVLYELITGRMAFEADSDYALMMKQLHEAPPAASASVADVPAALDALIQRAMAKHPAERFPNAVAFREELLQLAGIDAAPARRTPVPAATRLAPSPASDPARTAVPSHDSGPGALPATRMGDDRGEPGPAPTRLADDGIIAPQAPMSPAATAEHSRQPRLAGASPITSWLRDWRTFAIAAALLAAAGLGFRALRPAPVGGGASHATTSAGLLPAMPDTATMPSPPAPRENVASLIINPPAAATGGSGGVVVDAPDRRTTMPPGNGAPERPLGSERSKTGTPGKAGAPPSEPVRGADDVPPTRAETSPPSAREEESASAATDAIREALGRAATELSGAGTDAAMVLDDAVRPAWVALMKEGRVSMRVIGSPEVALRGARASATFDASVNVRSPFGANRRRDARFSAELQRNGSAWQVVALRPSERLDLK